MDHVVQIEETVAESKTTSIVSVIRTIFHCVCFIVWSGVMSYGMFIWIELMQNGTDKPILNDMLTLTPGFFTNWNFIFQTIFLGLSLSHDVLEWIDKQETVLGTKIRYWKNVFYNGMVVPYTLFVTAMFWTIYAIDRELVFPKVYDEVVPWWFNQCVHTNITIMLLIETLLQPRRYPTDEKMETILHVIIAVSYAVVYYSIYYFTGRWLYQVFGVMTWWQVCLFQLLIWSSCYFFYILHFPINRLIHGSQEVKENKGVREMVANINGVNGTGVNGNGVNGNGVNGNGVNESHGVNGVDNGINDKTASPFSNKSWSVKYRSIRNQFEKSEL